MTDSLSIQEISFHGWDAIKMSNGIIEAIAVPEIGGRLMNVSLGTHQFLFANPNLLGKRFTFEEYAGDGTILNWKNFGGEKTWPAPQGWDDSSQWAGPPDPVLDSGKYIPNHSVQEDIAKLTMTSPPDKRSGLRIHRSISMEPNSSRLHLTLTFENISDGEVTWSIWDVAQLDCALPQGGANKDCCVYLPVDMGNGKPYWVMYGEDNPQYVVDFQPDLMMLKYLGMVGKIGVKTRAGWVAFCNQSAGYSLCMQFPQYDNLAYPDNGATIECWTESPGAPSPVPIESPGYLMEVEVLSPLYTLQPGETCTQTIDWCLTQCAGSIIDVNQWGCVHQTLEAKVESDHAHVTGSFSCFDIGTLELVWMDSHEQPIDRIPIGTISPLKSIIIEQDALIPTGATFASIEITPQGDDQSHCFSSVSLTQH